MSKLCTSLRKLPGNAASAVNVVEWVRACLGACARACVCACGSDESSSKAVSQAGIYSDPY